MNGQRCDIAVIGAGPAGAVAAREAARRGLSVWLVDKARFPRPKVCGCCLNRDALATVARLGLGERVAALGGTALRRMVLASGHRCATFTMPGGTSVSRHALDAALVDAARDAGVRVCDNTSSSLGEFDATGHRVDLRGEDHVRTITAHTLIVADGVGGRFLDAHPAFTARVNTHSRIGVGAVMDSAPRFYERHTLYMTRGAAGYVGLVRLEDDALDVAAALDPAQVRAAGGPGALINNLLAESDWPTLPDATWKGTPRLTQSRRPVAHGRVMLAGDAAGYVEPFTGEGVAWALACGEAAAALAAHAVRNPHFALAPAWTKRYRRLVGARHMRCRLFAAALRRPSLVRAAVGLASRWPGLAQPLVQHVTAAQPEHSPRTGGIHA